MNLSYFDQYSRYVKIDENKYPEETGLDTDPGLILVRTLSTCDRHYIDVIMSAMASQITSLTIVYSTVYSVVDQRKYQSSASLAFVRGIHRWPVNSPHKG